MLLLPPRDRHDTGLIRAQFGIVHDFDSESPPFSLSLESTPFCDPFRFSSALHGRVRPVTLHSLAVARQHNVRLCKVREANMGYNSCVPHLSESSA